MSGFVVKARGVQTQVGSRSVCVGAWMCARYHNTGHINTRQAIPGSVGWWGVSVRQQLPKQQRPPGI